MNAAIVNIGLISEARFYSTQKGNGRIIHIPGSLSCAIDGYEAAGEAVEFMPENRQLRAKLREAEEKLEGMVKVEREFQRQCEAAKAAAAS